MNKMNNKIKKICLVFCVFVILLGGFILINDHEGITGFTIFENGLIGIFADTTDPVIELNSTLPSNITTNFYELWANFTDDDTGFVGNITLNELSNELTSTNLTFTGNENQTVYLKILKSANVKNATMNLTSHLFASCYQETANVSTACGGLDNGTYEVGVHTDYVHVGWIISTYQKPEGAIGAILQLKTNTTKIVNISIPDDCFNESNISIMNNLTWNGNHNIATLCKKSSGWQRISSDFVSRGCLSDSDANTKNGYDGDWSSDVYRFAGSWTSCPGTALGGILYEEGIYWNMGLYYPNNSYLEVGTVDGTHEWNRSGEFNGTNSTNDFASATNSNLSGCSTDILGYCLVPLLFHSDSEGILEISNINITYYSNRSCEVCIASDDICDTEWTISNVTNTYSIDNLSGNCSYSWDTTDYDDDINYNISFRIKDVAGNNATASKNITLDKDSPTFIYVYPLDNGAFNLNISNTTDINLTFSYNITDVSSVANCTFIFNHTVNQTDTSVTKNTDQNFNITISTTVNGTQYYNWSLNCTDIFEHSFSISTRNFTLIVVGNFSGSTTDLTTVNLSNISNLTFEETNTGKIIFGEDVDLTGVSNVASYVTITDNSIEINSSAIPALNKSATLYLYNLTYDNPRPLKDGEVCQSDTCTRINYSSGTFCFNVTRFSAYSAGESPISSSDGGGGSSGGGSSTKAVCSVGVIQCVSETTYRECIKNGSVNSWGETKNVLAGKMCKFGMLKDVEETEEVIEKEEPTKPTTQPPTLEEIKEEVPEDYKHILIIAGIILAGFGYLVWYEVYHLERKSKKKRKK